MSALTSLAPKLQSFFTETADRLARTTGFVKRASKLTGADFLQVLVFGFAEKPTASLTDLVEVAADVEVDITKQGLQTRMANAEAFLKAMFQEGLAEFRQRLPLAAQILEQFTGIFLTDSTNLALAASLQEDFPGSGGDGPVAVLKIQLTFDLLTGTFANLTFQTGRTPDQKYTGDLQAIQAGALYLSDLGYFALARFQAFAAQQAYFLSRFSAQTGLFEAETGEALDLLKWLQAQSEAHFECPVVMGKEAKLPARLAALRLPQEVAEQRRRRASEAAKRKGRTLSRHHLALLGWTVFVTNVPATHLTVPQLGMLYAVRWQIELLFKLWKSDYALDHTPGRTRARVLSEVYAKLIGLVVMHFLVAPYRAGARELSLVKAVYIIQHYLAQVLENLHQLDRLRNTLEKIGRRLEKNGRKGARQKRLTTYQKLQDLEPGLA